jgi:hypothetical protein
MCEKSPASIGGEMKTHLVRPSCIDTLRICERIRAYKGGLIFERTWIAIIIRREGFDYSPHSALHRTVGRTGIAW